MSWSWYNPSRDDAEEAYLYYKSRYNDTAAEKRRSEQAEQSYRNQMQGAVSQLNSAASQKLNFERRLQGIEDIIRILEGNGGWLSQNVPDAIAKAQRSLSKTNESFRKSMKHSDVAAASMETAFSTKTVDGDIHSAAALQAYRAEKNRLEQEISALKSQIANLSNVIGQWSSKINACNSQQAALRAAMNSYAYNMNHYRKYM